VDADPAAVGAGPAGVGSAPATREDDQTDVDVAEVPPASRRLAIAAFLLAGTSVLLAWWRVTWASGGSAIRDDVRLFRAEEPLTTAWGPWLTGAFVAAALLILFVRIAARSERYEPPVWRRDLLVAAGLLALALASCLLWPAEVPAFWGGRTYTADNVTTEVTETAMPGLGWWVAALATGLAALSWRVARPATEK
jgi:hypothetical protein